MKPIRKFGARVAFYTDSRMPTLHPLVRAGILLGAIAVVGLLRHRPGNAALEGAVAILFVIIGVAVKRRDATTSSRYTANRPE